MILRNVAIRHGRKALAAPIKKSLLRTITTEQKLPHEASVDGVSPGSGEKPRLNLFEKQIAHLPPKLQREAEIAHDILVHYDKQYGKKKRATDTNTDQALDTRNSIPPRSGPTKAEVKEAFYARLHNKATTDKLGSEIDSFYQPHDHLINPPKPEDVTLELLMASQAHLGHSTSLWNPMNQRYIYGVRQGIHIISLETTAAHLRRAAKVVEGVAYHGGLILFVGTRPGQSPCIVKAAELAQCCHLFEKWIPGSITNGDQILSKCGIKAVDMHDKVVDGYEKKLLDWSALKPDLVVCLNPLENYVLLHECGLNNIPTIGVIDTDADPTWVTYPIPANDDSIRCIQVIAGVLGRAGESGQQKRLKAAETGEVTWFPPFGLGNPETEEDRKRAAELKKDRGDLGLPEKGKERRRPRPRGRKELREVDEDDL